MKSATSFSAILWAAVLALLVPAAGTFAAQTPDSASISKLFRQAKADAARASDNVAYLYVNPNHDPQLYGLYL
jgi:hypothetical protein